MRATNSLRVSLEFQVPFKKSLYPLAIDLLFAKNIYHVYAV